MKRKYNVKRNKKCSLKKSTALLLIIAMLCSFSACRQSPVLVQKVYTNNQKTDDDKQKHNNDEKNDLEDENISTRKNKDDAKNENDYQHSLPQGGQEKNPNEADKTKANEEKEKNVTTEEDPILKPTKDRTKLRQVVDASGEKVDIPEDVDTVAALDTVAQYVEMLGGRGRVAATSQSFKNSDFVSAVFGSKEINSIPALWSGKGDNGITDENFNKLLEINPEVCLVESGHTYFTDNQLKKLSEKKIFIVTVPALATTENIKITVSILAEVLGDKSAEEGKNNASSVADKYIRWLNKIENKALGFERGFSGVNRYDFNYASTRKIPNRVNENMQTDGFYTLFVSSWDEDATYQVCTDARTIFSGTGMASATLGFGMETPISYYLSVGGACNTAALKGDPLRMSIYHSYLSPLLPTVMKVSGADTFSNDINNSLFTISNTSLGNDKFNKIIASSNKVADKVKLSAQSANGLWKYYPKQTINSLTGNYNTENEGVTIPSSICGEYTVYVSPSGVGEWASGAPESPLEMLWANMIFYGDCSKEDLKGETKDFYSKFYNYSLSDAAFDRVLTGR